MLNRSLPRIVLGTVQLGLPYGRNRENPVMPVEEAFAILDAAWDLGIHAFDTAEGYGDAPARLSEWLALRGLRDRTHVVTKVRPEALDTFREKAAAAVARFTGCASVTLLSHGICDAPFWNALVSVCERSGATAGQSVYGEAEVGQAVHCLRIGRVQAPANVFDHAAFRGRGAMPVPLDLRSVYLQGVLLDAPELAERRVRGAGVLARGVRQAATAVGADAAALLAASVLRTARSGDRIVVGVDRVEELGVLREIASVPESSLVEFERELDRIARDAIPAGVLDPRTW